jgi:hypothetical protein
MRIHIVARDYTSDQILARLAAQLAKHAAFTVGNTPDPKADLNYFFPYLERHQFPTFNVTPVAAWFSHKDTDRPEKVEMWDDAAVTIDLAITCAPLYYDELSAVGATELVTPPLDREMFKPLNAVPVRETRVVGTSGMVYPGGRKGEDMFGKLANDYPDLAFVASGSGWPVNTTRYQWDDMPGFYQGLDVYVCTSTIEGIGYGPLEALACGVPVVIPRGVGVFDELPDLENVHRYQAGDYKSLCLAVEVALKRLDEGGYNPTSLRGATARYTLEAWHNSHLRAFERLLYDVPQVKPSHPWHGKAGVYYVAYGEPARECATRAIASFKKHMPDGVEVALVSDTPLDAGEDIFIQHDDADIGGRSVKTQIYDLAPAQWEYVLYLDADTEVVADIGFLFQLLEDGWEAVFCTNPGKYVSTSEMRRPDNGDEVTETFAIMGCEELLQLNGGVSAFRRSEATARFFRAWHREWQRYGARDQAALDRVLYTEPIRVYVLGNEWNTITRYCDASITAGILHYPMTARRWRGRINGRLDGSEAWAAVHPSGAVTAK